MRTVDDESKRQSAWHAEQADAYAVRSHEVEGELSDAYSSLSEAHHQVSAAFAKKAGVVEPQDENEM